MGNRLIAPLPTKDMGEILYLTPEMYAKFLEDIKKLSPRKMNHEQIALMFETTMEMAGRISEVLDLEKEDLLPNETIRIRKAKGGWRRCSCSKWKFKPIQLISSNKNCNRCHGEGKFRIPQIGWVQPGVFARLLELAEQTDTGKKLFPITRRQALNYANELGSLRTHSFRHTWLTWLLESEKFNIRDIKQKARHTNVQTTMDYIEKNTDYTRKKERDVMGSL